MKNKFLLSALYLLIVAIFISCADKSVEDPGDPVPPAAKSVASCEGCHTNYNTLKSNYTPDPPAEGDSHGCGGEAPHFEPYDRVYLGGDGYATFKNDIHGKMPCISCHNGVDGTSDKTKAHSGDFIRKPSSQSASKCATCHPDIYLKTKNSLHEQGWGQKSMVVLRSGLSNIPTGFDQLSAVMKNGYDQNCGKCHASCGDCHVNRPSAGGGGLANGHAFTKTPDMRNVCVTCHVSRGGHAYFGQAIGTVPDVHLTNRQYSCLNCHTQNEVHGDGKIYDQRYKMGQLPKCENCHTDLNKSNSYHQAHISTFSCNTCHSQDYNNCGSCHIGGEGARVASYQGFKIGMNPIPDTKPFKYAVLRQSLMAPDSWDKFGVATLSKFDIRPTYKYATPHNIIRWTTRTQVAAGKQCYEACHVIKNGDGTFRNKQLYLFKSDLQSWEIPATQSITVDGKLPYSWGVR
ncbi:MAG: hypothetical protein WC061_10080 [Melioribacteraceae bacterium]